MTFDNEVNNNRNVYYTQQTSGVNSKHYFAGGQQLATRYNNALYYNLSDPTGTSLLMTNSSGEEIGRILYDGYGAILTNTLPMQLANTLPELPDTRTGLVHLGNGRYYDPAIGRPLQPNTAGAPPTMPQALNRYTAAAAGQPGVLQAAITTPALYNNPVLANTFRKALAQSGYEASRSGLRTYHRASVYTIIGDPIMETVTRAIPRSQLADNLIIGAAAVGLMGRDLAPTAWRGSINRVGDKLFGRALAINRHSVTTQEVIGYQFSYAHRLPAGRVAGGLIGSKLGLATLNFGIGLAVDVGYQALLDHSNPYLTSEQRNQRLLVAARGSAASFVAGGLAGIASSALFGLASGPAGWVAIGVGVGVAIAWEIWVAPAIYQARGLNPERALFPLQS
jgi:hypothetical protein